MSDSSPSDWHDLQDPADPPPLPPRGPLSARDIVWITRVAIFTAVGFIGWEWAAKASKFTALERPLHTRHTTQVEQVKSAAAAEMEAIQRELKSFEAAHRARITDPAIVDGSKARAAHNSEWQRRQAHDPRLAQSLAERSLLEMEQVGADKMISAKAALEKVASLASPPGSRVAVTPEGNLFAVKVAYRMAALTSGETGATTKHTSKASMRAEIQRLSAQVTRDLFTYCGSRGISSIALTCNHTTMKSILPPGATEEEKEILRSRAKKAQSKLHRVVLDGLAARNISNWSRASEGEILKLLRVDFDGFDSIQITTDISVDHTEAADPLIF